LPVLPSIKRRENTKNDRDSVKRELLKTPKSRLATEAKAEFTKVNEHFTDKA
jgi:hypothetical protein